MYEKYRNLHFLLRGVLLVTEETSQVIYELAFDRIFADFGHLYLQRL